MPATAATALLARLSGGDRRSLGHANAVVAQVLADPALFPALFRGLHHADLLVRIRSADALEKVTLERPDWLEPHAEELLLEIAGAREAEIRWHVAQMLPRLVLTRTQRAVAVKILKNYLNDKSSIVRTFALQALADFSVHDAHLRDDVMARLRQATRTGTPAMKTRASKLLKQLNPRERDAASRGPRRKKSPAKRR